ncbi:phage tail protein [Propioniciclava tarda]|jgi:phage tail-like protein|nr:phage tail protein [Propioniciclava tarda]SMO79044.1 conserved hypothetical phage tail region protein [Propioniciclava tarda]HOA88674.1 phage tail protein [Propioniciclava tarda]HQA31059.1 phage tail protein [Propioniciclava tarda]
MALLGAFNFSIKLIETAKPVSAMVGAFSPPVEGGFSECTGLEASLAVDEYREGGRNDAVLRFPGRITHPNLRLRRGLVTEDLWRWHEQFILGRGKRRDGVIELLDETGNAVRTWRFRRGLPVRWAGPAFNANTSTLAVEEVEIAHEGLFTQAGGAVGEFLNTVASVFGGS